MNWSNEHEHGVVAIFWLNADVLFVKGEDQSWSPSLVVAYHRPGVTSCIVHPLAYFFHQISCAYAGITFLVSENQIFDLVLQITCYSFALGILCDVVVSWDVLRAIGSLEEVRPGGIKRVNSSQARINTLNRNPKIPAALGLICLYEDVEVVTCSKLIIHSMLDELGCLLDIVAIDRTGVLCVSDKRWQYLWSYASSCHVFKSKPTGCHRDSSWGFFIDSDCETYGK